MQKREILKSISKVENYLLEKYQVEVYYEAGSDNAYYESLGRIEVDSYQNYLYRLFTLLHEAGHVQVRKGLISPWSPAAQFSSMKFSPEESCGTVSQRIDILREEVLAWEAASMIASLLDIEVGEKMNTHRNNCLKTYVDWI